MLETARVSRRGVGGEEVRRCVDGILAASYRSGRNVRRVKTVSMSYGTLSYINIFLYTVHVDRTRVTSHSSEPVSRTGEPVEGGERGAGP